MFENSNHHITKNVLMYPLFLVAFLIFPFLASCDRSNESTKKQRTRNLKGEFIYRNHNEILFIPPPPRRIVKEKYPWEEKFIGKHPRITKEFFRCKGNGSNPVQTLPQEGKEPIRYFDCGGAQKHGLPLDNGREFIFPCLIELLNYLQEKTGKQIIITSGHRCPQHNLYCDHSKTNWASKHMIGAEVDFYIVGFEDKPQEIVNILNQYYKNKEPFKGYKEYELFHRYEKDDLNISTPPWYNKEIFIKFYKRNEGRNFDNRHSFPYISIQVRYDRQLNISVGYDPKKAQNFLRF